MKTILVCGITRSGLTATMQMLDAGGYPCYGTYPAFEDNHNQVEAGKACKLVDTQHCFPPKGDYHVILLRRIRTQQAKSITKMLRIMAGIFPTKRDTLAMEKSIASDWNKIYLWGQRQSGLLVIDFEKIITEPLEVAEQLVHFTGKPLCIGNMKDIIVPRSIDCYPTMLEFKMI